MVKAKCNGGLGFRAFSAFNKALLGKQCWRLINDENSLMAKVFRSRYYPRSNFLDATIGHQPSYAWRSMFQAKEVIEMGARWRVGSHKISIWKDSWLPEQAKFKVCSPIRNLALEALVSELIDSDTRQWKKALIIDSFSPFEAQQILNIPISWRLLVDKIIWNWEKDGNYSVKSAYHSICHENTRNVVESSGSESKGLWKEIWKVQVPNGARNFLWRMEKGILPTRHNLMKKDIHLETLYPICNAETETQDHLFLVCHTTRALWFATPLGIHAPVNVDVCSWLLKWLQSSDSNAAQIVSITLWKIWQARNNLFFNNVAFNPVEIANSAADFFADFVSANGVKTCNRINIDAGKWDAPESGFLKLNVDAGCFENGSTGWGLIVRNHKGEVLFAATKKEAVSMPPLLAETLGLRWALSWVKNQHMEYLEIEKDSELTVKSLKGLFSSALIDHIILDCHDILLQHPNILITHIKRCKNSAANGLVQVAKSLGTSSWVGNVPRQINHIVCNDILNIY